MRVAAAWFCKALTEVVLIGGKAKDSVVLVNEKLEMVQKIHTQQAVHT